MTEDELRESLKESLGSLCVILTEWRDSGAPVEKVAVALLDAVFKTINYDRAVGRLTPEELRKSL